MAAKRTVSVIIPTIEEETVFNLIGEIRKSLGLDTEIIIVDKSGDEYFEKLKKTGATVIRQKDSGVERAIMTGLRRAHGDIIASIDADGTHDPSGLKAGARLIESGKYDLVLGNRMNRLEKGSMSVYIRFGNWFLSRLFSRLYHMRTHDVLTGLFVMDRKAFEEIKDIDPYRAGISFFAIELARRGYRVGEVDISYYPRLYGRSKLTKSKFMYGINVASHLIRQIRDYSPLAVFGGIGFVAIVLGLVLGLSVLLTFLHTGFFNETGRALISFMLVVLGFLLIVAGFVLDLLLEIEKVLNRKKT